jgi:hypothetical protein
LATQDVINQWLGEGIKAARAQETGRARQLLFKVIDHQPRNEVAWLWLSAVMDNSADRKICLENVLTLNPRNTYARRGLQKLENSAVPVDLKGRSAQEPAATGWPAGLAERVRASNRPTILWLLSAFWTGLALLLLGSGLIEIVEWSRGWLRSRVPLSSLRSTQTVAVLIVIALIVGGLMALTVAWSLYGRYKSGFYGSLLLALGLLLVGPIFTLLLEPPNFLALGFLGLMPAVVALLTLASLPLFEDRKTNDRVLVSKP